MSRPLSLRQQRFVDAYNGDIAEAAELAGVSYQYCRQLMSLPKYSHIRELIDRRESTISNNLIKTRTDRQQFWSDMMQDSDVKACDRLKASELLGKSEADFIERKRLESADGKELKWTVEVVPPQLKITSSDAIDITK